MKRNRSILLKVSALYKQTQTHVTNATEHITIYHATFECDRPKYYKLHGKKHFHLRLEQFYSVDHNRGPACTCIA